MTIGAGLRRPLGAAGAPPHTDSEPRHGCRHALHTRGSEKRRAPFPDSLAGKGPASCKTCFGIVLVTHGQMTRRAWAKKHGTVSPLGIVGQFALFKKARIPKLELETFSVLG